MYETLWRNKFLTLEAETVEQMAERLEAAARELREMAAAGVRLDGGADQDYARLVTEDLAVALEFGLAESAEPEEIEGGEEEEEEGWVVDGSDL